MTDNQATNDRLERILKTIEAQANALKDLTLEIRGQAQDVITLRKDLQELKTDNNNFKEEIVGVRKQILELTCLSGSAFVQRVCEDTSEGNNAQKEIASGDHVDLTVMSSPKQKDKGGNRIAHSTAIPDQHNKLSHNIDDRRCSFHIPPDHCALPPARLSTYAILPMEYDGRIPWSQYEVHFEAVSCSNGWTSDAKAVYFPAYLRGTALAYYQTLDSRTREDFDRMCEAFRLRFNVNHQRSIAHVQLRNRVQKPGESFPEYATDLQRLTLLTFGDCTESARDRIALEQFLDGIYDLEVQQRVRDVDPATLQDALQTAIRIEANHRATRAARRNIRASFAHAVDNPPNDVSNRSNNRRTMQDDRSFSQQSGNDQELA